MSDITRERSAREPTGQDVQRMRWALQRQQQFLELAYHVVGQLIEERDTGRQPFPDDRPW